MAHGAAEKRGISLSFASLPIDGGLTASAHADADPPHHLASSLRYVNPSGQGDSLADYFRYVNLLIPPTAGAEGLGDDAGQPPAHGPAIGLGAAVDLGGDVDRDIGHEAAVIAGGGHARSVAPPP